jgi:hypothetical protein
MKCFSPLFAVVSGKLKSLRVFFPLHDFHSFIDEQEKTAKVL